MADPGPQNITPPKRSSRARWLGVAVVAIALLSMGRLCAFDFTSWDDLYTIHHNPRLNPPTAATLAHYWTHEEMGLYIPATYTVWSALAGAGRLAQPDDRGIQINPWLFHTTSVVLHALAALVVYTLLRRLGMPDVPAFFGAALFAVHPVQVEAVGWVSGMKDVLCGFFSLIAVWQYVAFVQSRRRLHLLLGTASLLWAMLCKPTAVVVPAMAVALDWIILDRPLRKVLWSTSAWWVLAIACAIVAKIAQPGTGIPTVAPWLRPLVALDALAFYLYKLILPIHLAIDYGRAPRIALQHGWLFWTWMVPIVLLALLTWRRSRWPIAAALIFVIGLSPVLGLTPFLFQAYSTVADHYLYLPMLGAAAGVAWVISRFPHPGVRFAAGAILALFAFLSLQQASVWQNDQSLFAHSIAVNPNSFLSYGNLGNAYTALADIHSNAAEIAEHLGHIDAAADYRDQARAEYSHAAELQETALEKFKLVHDGHDDYLVGHSNLAYVLRRVGRAQEAVRHRVIALHIQKGYPDRRRGDLIKPTHELARDYMSLGRYDEALKYLDWVLQYDPNNREAAEDRRRALASLQHK